MQVERRREKVRRLKTDVLSIFTAVEAQIIIPFLEGTKLLTPHQLKLCARYSSTILLSVPN